MDLQEQRKTFSRIVLEAYKASGVRRQQDFAEMLGISRASLINWIGVEGVSGLDNPLDATVISLRRLAEIRSQTLDALLSEIEGKKEVQGDRPTPKLILSQVKPLYDFALRQLLNAANGAEISVNVSVSIYTAEGAKLEELETVRESNGMPGKTVATIKRALIEKGYDVEDSASLDKGIKIFLSSCQSLDDNAKEFIETAIKHPEIPIPAQYFFGIIQGLRRFSGLQSYSWEDMDYDPRLADQKNDSDRKENGSPKP